MNDDDARTYCQVIAKILNEQVRVDFLITDVIASARADVNQLGLTSIEVIAVDKKMAGT